MVAGARRCGLSRHALTIIRFGVRPNVGVRDLRCRAPPVYPRSRGASSGFIGWRVERSSLTEVGDSCLRLLRLVYGSNRLDAHRRNFNRRFCICSFGGRPSDRLRIGPCLVIAAFIFTTNDPTLGPAGLQREGPATSQRTIRQKLSVVYDVRPAESMTLPKCDTEHWEPGRAV